MKKKRKNSFFFLEALHLSFSNGIIFGKGSKNMKKFLQYFSILVVALMIPFVVSAAGKEKVKVYIFHGSTCPHCHEALEFFDELSQDDEYKDMYELIKYEVWNDKNNRTLMGKVAEKLNVPEEDRNGVPFIVIGEKFFSGYSASIGVSIKSEIKAAYESGYEDVVKPIAEGEVDSDTGTIFTIVILGAVVVGFGVLVFMAREPEKNEEAKTEKKIQSVQVSYKKEVTKKEPIKNEVKKTTTNKNKTTVSKNKNTKKNS